MIDNIYLNIKEKIIPFSQREEKIEKTEATWTWNWKTERKEVIATQKKEKRKHP